MQGASCVGQTRGRPHASRARQTLGPARDKEGDVEETDARATASPETNERFFETARSSTAEGTLGAAAYALLSRERMQGGPNGRRYFTYGLPGGSVLSSPSYRMGVVRCDPGSRRHGFATRGARVEQVGVNPPRRAVATVGAESVTERRAAPDLRQPG
jgi:hypothetical protein